MQDFDVEQHGQCRYDALEVREKLERVGEIEGERDRMGTGMQIELTLQDFDLEQHGQCRYDSLEVRSGGRRRWDRDRGRGETERGNGNRKGNTY